MEKQNWADEIVQQADKLEEETLNKQALKCIERIAQVELTLKKHPSIWAYELQQMKRMYQYVAKHKFLPESYVRMLRLWECRSIGK